MKKIKLNFRSLGDALLEVKSGAVKEAMTGSPFFTPAPAQLTAMNAALDAFILALALSKMGGKNEVADKKVKRDALITALFALANYVSLTANGDEQVLIASGFDLYKERQPAPPLGEVSIAELNNTVQPGAVLVGVAPVQSVRMYQYQCTPDPVTDNSEWASDNSTQSKYTFKNLETGKKYWFKVVALGTDGQSSSSDAQSKTAA